MYYLLYLHYVDTCFSVPLPTSAERVPEDGCVDQYLYLNLVCI